jgi:REP element-mobilizing transposase RayT
MRLQGYDYSQAAAYFVTICTHDRGRLFGDAVEGQMRVNPFGGIVQSCWAALPLHYPRVELDAFVVMPNHVHGVLILTVGAGLKPAPTEPSKFYGLPEVIRGFKTFSSRRINEMRNTPGQRLWQRSYYEHIIRDQDGLDSVRQYILSNPAQWSLGQENPLVGHPLQGQRKRRGGFETRPYGAGYGGESR